MVKFARIVNRKVISQSFNFGQDSPTFEYLKVSKIITFDRFPLYLDTSSKQILIAFDFDHIFSNSKNQNALGKYWLHKSYDGRSRLQINPKRLVDLVWRIK